MKIKKILYLVKVPPPIHGSTMMNKIIADSIDPKDSENIILEQSISEDTEDIGKISIKKIFRVFLNYTDLLIALIKIRPTLIYFALSPLGSAFLKDSISVALIKIFKIPIVYHMHGKGIKDISEKNKFYRKLYNFVFDKQYAIVLSNYLKYDVEGFGLKEIFVVGNGIEPIDPESFQKSRNTRFVITYLSNFVKEKGILEFIDLLRELKGKNINFDSYIIGKPMDIKNSHIEKQIKKYNLTENIKHLGPAYGDEKFKFLGSTNIFVFPTYYRNECYPLVLLEAKMFGIPVITSNEGGIKDIIKEGENGFILDPHDIQGMAEKTILLYKDKKLSNRISQQNRKIFLKEHTAEKFVENIRNVNYSILQHINE